MNPVLVRSAALLAVVPLAGTAGYVWIEGWDPWRALFFTLITLTTVGYGDEGLSPAGERFTALVMIGGIGTASFALGQLVHTAVAQTLRPERRIMHKARALRDHHIICGFGRMGRYVARRLHEAGTHFVIIERDEHLVERARAGGMLVLEGDGSDDELLEIAGVEHAASLAALTPSDATNALIALSAHAMAPDLMIVARAESDEAVPKLRRAGAQRVISPTCHGAEGVAQDMLRPEVSRLLMGEHDGGDKLTFSQIRVCPRSPLLGKTLAAIGAEHPSVVFIAVATGQRAPAPNSTSGSTSRSTSGSTTEPAGTLRVRPDSSTELREGDVLIIAGEPGDIAASEPSRRAA